MRIALVLAFLLFQTGGARVLPATDVTADQIQAALQQGQATHTIDTPIRTVDAGGHHVGIGIVHRERGTNLTGSASHDRVTEVYQVLQGSGTLVTGGVLTDPKRRGADAREVGQINGPGVSGTGIDGGVRRHIGKGDMVIIPAGTPHWFPEIQEDIVYTVVRVDPSGVVNLK